MSLASVASQQNTPQTTSATGTGTTANSALGSLSGNFSTFLKMLMTQLRNQNPTSPLDTNARSSELLALYWVEQQISANTSVSKLIELTQAGEVMQSSAMLGRHVTVQADELVLQDGKATVNFAAPDRSPSRSPM